MDNSKKKTFDQLMREATPEEREALTPPHGQYIPAALRRAVYKRDGYACFYCGKKSSDMKVAADLTLDHFIPRYLGGVNTLENLFTACRSCNCRKGKLGPGQIAERLARGIRKFGV